MVKKSFSEQEVRTRSILPAIKDAGWDNIQIREDYPITKGRIVARGNTCSRERSKRADFVLFYKTHIPIAIIEAKDNNHSISAGMQQALDYAQRMEVPFVLSSNGDGFVFHNRFITDGEREVIISNNSFPSPETLWQIYCEQKSYTDEQKKIALEPYFTQREDKQPRYYQINAINKTVEAIMLGKQRILVVMATGTGKTFTAFQIIWRLWKAGVKKRILFLADRNALIDQTFTNDFAPFKDKMTIIRNRKVDKSYEIYLALYQGLTGEGDKEIFKQFSPEFFDLVIVDECHRGSAAADSAWREVLEYYTAAIQIGLTATPRETKAVSNIDYFGDPIYTYSLKQGIEDGFLAPYRVIRVLLDKDAEGFRPYLGQTDRFGNIIEDREYNIKDYDRELVLEKRTKIVAKVVSDYLKTHNARMDKSIFFCVDTDHADRMRQALINENADMVAIDERYVMRITGDDDIGKKQLDNFRDVECKYPVLVTTSKLLTTGIDAQMVKYIILDSNINSMTEFKQIIGRGTRVREELGKMFFTIFDFRDVTRLFADPEFDGPYEQDEEYHLNNGSQPQTGDPPVVDSTVNEKPNKYYVNDVDVTVLKQRVQYIGLDGKLITESLTDYTKRNVQGIYATLDDFLNAWNAADRKQAILDELAAQGVLIEELQEQVGRDFDPFDLLCHIVFDKLPLTRKERAEQVKKRNYFTKYGAKAAAILEELLNKYADSGIANLEDINVLKVDPIKSYGTPVQIINGIFGGKEKFKEAIRALERELYVA